jgi:hypothetical protein
VPEDDAMESDSRSEGEGKGALEELMRERIRVLISQFSGHGCSLWSN